MFASHISLRTLELFSRSLGTMLDSGVPVLKALTTLSRRTGNSRCRRVLEEVAQQVKQGDEISVAMREQAGYFPDLYCDMVSVAEHTGGLPEVLRGLADHYDNLLRTRRMFLAAIAWPVIQLVGAIFIVGGLIYLLGTIGQSTPNAEPTDMLGWGLLGPRGAMIWFGSAFGLIGGAFALYWLLKTTFRQQRLLDSVLLKVPVIGRCMRSFAIARFAWGLHLTQNAGMAIVPSLEASLRATGNGAFQGMSRVVVDRIKEGDELSVALEATSLFPEDFLHTVQVAETSGTVPEALHRLSPQFEDQARRSLALLATAATVVVWLFVAGMIIFVVFSIIFQYLAILNSVMDFK